MLLLWLFVIYAITILLLIPESAFQSTGHKVFFKIILNTLKTHTFMGFKRKPARIDLGQAEWTFSDDELDQSLFLRGNL